MPIYAYRCAACGHAKDVLQKIADPVLTTCPACGAESFQKQLTAAGFQLKGSGWYATDFKGGAAAKPADAPAATPAPSSAPAAGADGGSPSTPTASASSSTPAAGGCGSSCACH
jgi:putative FmdB family regulatory protein